MDRNTNQLFKNLCAVHREKEEEEGRGGCGEMCMCLCIDIDGSFILGKWFNFSYINFIRIFFTDETLLVLKEVTAIQCHTKHIVVSTIMKPQNLKAKHLSLPG